MDAIENKFARLTTDNAPGQEIRQATGNIGNLLVGDELPGRLVDFSHGDVDAFTPIPGALDAFVVGVQRGGSQAYTEYRGDAEIRMELATRLAAFTGAPIDAERELIITPGTQGALFLAMGATVTAGTKVAIVEPDYFANRKLVRFLDGEIMPVRLNYLSTTDRAGIDLEALETAFKDGARVLVFSNPNNPTGVIYSEAEIRFIASMAERYDATVIVDQLYSRLLYEGRSYSHVRSSGTTPENVITIIGPSKTESLSGYRLGVAFGPAPIIDRMEKLQAIVSLRAPGYNQAALTTWLNEPEGWIGERIRLHQAIRDSLLAVLARIAGVKVRSPEAGSYLFPALPGLKVDYADFVRILRHQAKVTVTPGTEFCPFSADSIRFNFSQNHEAAVQAMERVGTLIARYRR